MRLVIDHRRCRRTGQCSYLHPELFKAGEDGAPIVLVEHPDEELREAAEAAARTKDMPSGTRNTLRDGTTTSSPNVPGTCSPRIWYRTQRLCSPRRQNSHAPQ